MLIDLTHPFTEEMPVYPGDPRTRLSQIRFVKDTGLADHWIESGMHVGTHLDAPRHVMENGASVLDLPLSRLTGNGHLIDARNKEIITPDMLAGCSIGRGDIVLVRTDWSKKFRDPDYFDAHPVVAEGFARRLVEVGVSIAGFDTPSPDREPYPVHKILLGGNVLIIENLANLEALATVTAFRVYAFPVKFEADGAPVRVVAETAG